MSFFQKKKLLRDRASGLVFLWRGVSTSSTFPVIFAFLFTALAVLFLFFGLTVEAPEARGVSKNSTTEISYISEVHPQLVSYSQFYSPIPPRWDPLDDEEVIERVMGQLHRDIVASPMREIKLIEPQPIRLDTTLPLVVGRSDILPPIKPLAELQKPSEGTCYLNLSIHSDTLSQRLSTQPEYKGKLLWEDREKSATYYIMVDEGGEVQLCSPLDSQGLPGVEGWLRSFSFKPSQSTSVISKVEVTIEGGLK